jgi:hypothetical protein
MNLSSGHDLGCQTFGLKLRSFKHNPKQTETTFSNLFLKLFNLESWLLNFKAQSSSVVLSSKPLVVSPKHLELSFALPLSRHWMCLVHIDDNIVASGCMAFARPSQCCRFGLPLH